MKKNLFVIICVLMTWTALAGLVSAKAAAVVDNPVFTFDAVPEGVHVNHDFIVKNTGTIPLNILKVVPP